MTAAKSIRTFPERLELTPAFHANLASAFGLKPDITKKGARPKPDAPQRDEVFRHVAMIAYTVCRFNAQGWALLVPAS